MRQEETKRKLDQAKKMKIQKTKVLKDSNRIIRENIVLLKDKIKYLIGFIYYREENKQKKILVETKKEIMKSSIMSFQNKKKNLINELLSDEISKEKKDVEIKENELMFWKHQYERKIIDSA